MLVSQVYIYICVCTIPDRARSSNAPADLVWPQLTSYRLGVTSDSLLMYCIPRGTQLACKLLNVARSCTTQYATNSPHQAPLWVIRPFVPRLTRKLTTKKTNGCPVSHLFPAITGH